MKFHALLTRALGGCESVRELARSDNFAPVTHSIETNATFWTIVVMH
jgi:hypothetical protein